jgi:hypothetical protein
VVFGAGTFYSAGKRHLLHFDTGGDMRNFVSVSVAAVFCFALPAQSQTIDVNHQNRTVEVNVTEEIQAEAEIADVTLGCMSYGKTHEGSLSANPRRVKARLLRRMRNERGAAPRAHVRAVRQDRRALLYVRTAPSREKRLSTRPADTLIE